MLIYVCLFIFSLCFYVGLITFIHQEHKRIKLAYASLNEMNRVLDKHRQEVKNVTHSVDAAMQSRTRTNNIIQALRKQQLIRNIPRNPGKILSTLNRNIPKRDK